MSSSRHDRLSAVFTKACELQGQDRARYLDQVREEDPELVAEVESLLAAAAQDHDILDHTVDRALGTRILETLGDPLVGRQVGRYTVQRVIAHGGMGTVYEATQESPHRTVALKVMKAGLARRSALRRFAIESQILGHLRHPGIAQVFEASVFDQESGGMPYFVMEYIPNAQPITDFAKQEALGLHQRLSLFSFVCDAVHHGHQKGVIHRDLKPGNVLVDENGHAKVIDFGVARASDIDVQITTMRTEVGHLIGTVAYMSPEQVAGDSSALDTRSDVYALGVLLYELLADRLPQDVDTCSLAEAARRISEENPTRLSSIHVRFRGDVETIVAKSLEKAKDRRYQSAAEMAADIRRHLRDEPISARPPSITYQFQKLAKRNKGLVAGAGLAVIALVAGIVISAAFGFRAVAARKQAVVDLERAREAEQLAQDRLEEVNKANLEAEQQTRIARAINDFLNNDLLTAVRPEVMGVDVGMQEVLRAASARLDGKFDDQPLVEAAIRMTIGTTYLSLGQSEQAEPHLRRAIALQSASLGEEHDDTLESTNDLLQVLQDQGRMEEAEPLLVSLYETRRRVKGDQHPHTLRSANNLASFYIAAGRYDVAEPLLVDTLETRRRLFGDEARDTLTPMNNLGLVYERQGRYKESYELYKTTLATRRRLLGDNHRETVVTIINMAGLSQKLARYDTAEALYLEGVNAFAAELGPEHLFTLISKGRLGALYTARGRFDEADDQLGATIEVMRRELGAEHPRTLAAMNALVRLYLEQDRAADAAVQAASTRDACLRVQDSAHPETLIAGHNLAESLLHQAKLDRAAEVASETLESQTRVLGRDHPDTLRSALLAARIYQAQGRAGAADRLFQESTQGLQRSLGNEHPRSAKARGYYGAFLAGQGRFAAAEEQLLAAHRHLVCVVGDTHHDTRSAAERLAVLYELWNAAEPGDELAGNAAEWRAVTTER